MSPLNPQSSVSTAQLMPDNTVTVASGSRLHRWRVFIVVVGVLTLLAAGTCILLFLVLGKGDNDVTPKFYVLGGRDGSPVTASSRVDEYDLETEASYSRAHAT